MCGIYAFCGKKNAEEQVITGLKQLEYRGYDSWGLASLDMVDNLKIEKQVGAITESELQTLEFTSLAVGHTRWATHGKVNRINAHPQVSPDKNLALVHNGIAENLDEIISVLGPTKFASETDTEKLLLLFEQLNNGESNLAKCLSQFAQTVTGNNVLVILDRLNQRIIGISLGLPLYLGYGDDNELHLSSDLVAFPKTIKEYVSLAKGQAVVLQENSTQFVQLNSSKELKQISRLPMPEINHRQNKGKFDHFMLKEMHEQKSVIGVYQQRDLVDLKQMIKPIKQADSTFLVGCGSSYHACLYGANLLNQLGIKAQAVLASELSQLYPVIRSQDVILMVSQSGETADLLEHVELLRSKSVELLVWTNVGYSRLAQLADSKHLLLAGQEKSVVSTKAFVAQLASFQALVRLIAHQPLEDLWTDSAANLSHLLNSRESRLILNSAIKLIHQCRTLYLLGKGAAYPLALETALKIKESSYLPAQALQTGELKHGSLALIDKQSICLVHALTDQHLNKNLASVSEIKSRGGKVIGITSQDHPDFDLHLPSLAKTLESEVLIQTLWGQLLGYHLAVRAGLNPDKPRNLAKSVTVC